jgi:hypothetical protein
VSSQAGLRWCLPALDGCVIDAFAMPPAKLASIVHVGSPCDGGLSAALSMGRLALAACLQEKLRPIDKKLAYQMEKLLKAAQEGPQANGDGQGAVGERRFVRLRVSLPPSRGGARSRVRGCSVLFIHLIGRMACSVGSFLGVGGGGSRSSRLWSKKTPYCAAFGGRNASHARACALATSRIRAMAKQGTAT